MLPSVQRAQILSRHGMVQWNPNHWFGWPKFIKKYKRPIKWLWL